MPQELLKYKDARRIRTELAEYAEPRINLSSNARLIFGNVYQKNLETGERESVAERMAAIATDIASADMKYMPKEMPYKERVSRVKDTARQNLELYVSNEFRANTPTNINFGRWEAAYDDNGDLTGYQMRDQMGSACFVIPVEDTFGSSIENLDDGILEAWVTQQMLHKGGGGTGFSFCAVRPKGSVIGYNPAVDGMKSIEWSLSRGVSSGYESFLENFFNAATDAVKQGNTRRGANMGIQRIDHMDFLDHMYAKFGRDKHRLEYRMKNFNLSLAVTDEFMEAAINGGTYTLYNPHRASPKIKGVLEKKYGIERPEIVRVDDIATREQFEKIMAKNKKNPMAPVTTPSMYRVGNDVINAYSGESIGTIVDGVVRVEAAKVLRIFSELSHANGEPGMVFIDRINEFNPNLFDEEIDATNPCGEQPIPKYDACDLGSINTGKFARYKVFDSEKEVHSGLEEAVLEDRFTKLEDRKDGKVGVMYFDWNALGEIVDKAVRFLDNLIDRNDFPGQKIIDKVHQNRKVGLGYMGVWDAMVLMKQRYGSDESYEFAEALAKTLHEKSIETSMKLAEERGEFPAWETSFFNPDSPLYSWFMSNPKTITDRFRGERKLSSRVKRDRKMTYGVKVRNSYRTTQAPTGTIRRSDGEIDVELGLDNLAISSGVEPIYTLWEESEIMNTTLQDLSLASVRLLERENLLSDEVIKAIKENRGSAFIYSYTKPEVAKVLKRIPEDVRNVLVTAAGGEKDQYEITAEQHAKMATVFQGYNDSAISKTINLPNSATPEDMTKAWLTLWQNGSKGGTVYRDSSREFQILNVVKGEAEVTGEKFRRTLLQNSFTVESPYMASQRNSDNGDTGLEPQPDRCFTTVTYDPVRKRVTGVFQNVGEVDPERLALLNSRNIMLSTNLKKGRSLDDVIEEMKKVSVKGSRSGVIYDEGVLSLTKTKDVMRHRLTGGTTTESLLGSLYLVRFLTENGKNFNSNSIDEKMSMYLTGKIPLRAIINTEGKITLEEDKEKALPSILGNGKVLKLPPGMSEKLCPECN